MPLSTPSAWDEEIEVLVIGGGPGGSTTAGRLAQRGRKALVLEQSHFPRFHIGESLLPASAPVLKALGLEEEMDRRFVRKYSARFFDDAVPEDSPRASARYAFSEAFAPAIPFAWQVPRADFDHLLLRRAAELGAEVREGWRVQKAIFQGDTIVGVEATSAAGDMRRIGARVVVDATGREALLTRARSGTAGGEPTRKRIPGLDKTALFTHVQGGHRNVGIDEGQIELIILAGQSDSGATSGWAWFIPFRDGRSSVGFVLSSDVVGARIHDSRALFGDRLGPAPREYADRPAEASARLAAIFDAEVERSPTMRRLIGNAPRIGQVRAAADYSFRVQTLAGDGWLAVGDAAGFIDPLFSTGGHLAMGGGDRAAAVIDAALTAGDVSGASFMPYAKMVRSATDLFLGAVQSFYRGELRGLLFADDQRAVLRRIITSMLAGDVFHDESASSWVGFFRERFAVEV
jgi:flavin-dependent dehydrogenase